MSVRRGWLELPAAHRRAIVSTTLSVPLAHASIQVFGYRRVMKLAEWSAGNWLCRQPQQPSPDQIEALRLAATRVQRYSPVPGNCLSRSLVLWWQLQRRGLGPNLRLGVSLAGGKFAAHAWVECEGRVLNDRQDVGQRYTPFTGAAQHGSFE